MTDAERKNLVLGEGPRLKLEREEGEEISRLVREGIEREVNGLVEKGELVWGEADGNLWAGLSGSGVRL
jgi:hypothetical protein